MILCGRSARHLHVANTLCRAGETVAIVQETGGDWSLKRVLKKLRPDNLVRKGWRWLRDRRRYAGNPEARFFFPHGDPKLDHPELVREVSHINHPEVVNLARELRPDLICVFGTSLIRGELLKEGRLGIINLHGGLSPEYRGADCTFWALHNGEPEKVGCTLHYIDAGIDTGRLIAHISPEVHEGDKCMKATANWCCSGALSGTAPKSMPRQWHAWRLVSNLAWLSPARGGCTRSRIAACVRNRRWPDGWLPGCWRG